MVTLKGVSRKREPGCDLSACSYTICIGIRSRDELTTNNPTIRGGRVASSPESFADQTNSSILRAEHGFHQNGERETDERLSLLKYCPIRLLVEIMVGSGSKGSTDITIPPNE